MLFNGYDPEQYNDVPFNSYGDFHSLLDFSRSSLQSKRTKEGNDNITVILYVARGCVYYNIFVANAWVKSVNVSLLYNGPKFGLTWDTIRGRISVGRSIRYRCSSQESFVVAVAEKSNGNNDRP
jgi:hypothetical protein